MTYTDQRTYEEKVRAAAGQIPPPTVPSAAQTTVQIPAVSSKKKFSLPQIVKLDPSFRRRYEIGRDVFLAIVIVKLVSSKFAVTALLPIVSFQVIIPVGFALIVAGAATGKSKWIEWGAGLAIGASFGIWLFL